MAAGCVGAPVSSTDSGRRPPNDARVSRFTSTWRIGVDDLPMTGHDGLMRVGIAVFALGVAAFSWAVLQSSQQSSDSVPRPASVPSTWREIPNVYGLPRSQAECRLAAAGFRWRTADSPGVEALPRPGVCAPDEDGFRVRTSPDPPVTDQQPFPGDPAAPGTVVVLRDHCTGRACL